MDKALFEVVLKDGQKFNVLLPTGYWSMKNDFWLDCTVLGQDVSISLDDIASVKYAGGIAYQMETRKPVVGCGDYDYIVTDMLPVLRFPFKKVPVYESFDCPEIDEYNSGETYAGDILFRRVSWRYTEYVQSDESSDRLCHMFETYMTEDDYRKLIAQWARELADRNIHRANS